MPPSIVYTICLLDVIYISNMVRQLKSECGIYWYVDICKICIRFSDIECLFGESYKYPCLINNEGKIQKDNTDWRSSHKKKKKERDWRSEVFDLDGLEGSWEGKLQDHKIKCSKSG